MSDDKKYIELYDLMVEYGVCTEEEIALVCSINGTNLHSLESILFSRTGWRRLDQWKERELNTNS